MSGVATDGRTFYVAGGTLAVEADSYVERSADKALREALLAGRFCYVLNSRQMGKSSLCVRTMSRLDADGVHTAFVDLTKIGGRNVTPEQWYAGIAFEIGRSLNLRNEIRTHWAENSHLSPLQRLFGALREVGLAQFNGKIAIFFDEIDATRSLPFSPDEFFAGIRECYNRRVQDKEYSRLTFCLLGVAVPSDLINSPTSTPFNIGERIYLKDFTLEEAMSLATGLSASNAKSLIERVFYWTNGHPFLTQSLCEALAQQPQATIEDVDALVRRDLFQPNARETNINLADVANRALHAGDLEAEPEKFRADLLSAYEKAWKDKPLADDESNRVAALLKLSGIMRSEGNRLYVRNRIYRHVFGREWIKENMPGQELRRQRRAFYVGVFRTAFIATAVTAAISWLAWNNARLARLADLARTRAEYGEYVADVNSMQEASDSGDMDMMRTLLDKTANSPYRSIEWNYWNAKFHNADGTSNYPKGLGTIYMSGDGRNVIVEDRRYLKSTILSLPDLKVVKQLNMPGADFDPWWLGNRAVWAREVDPGTSQVFDIATGKPLGAIKVDPGGVVNTGTETRNGQYWALVWSQKNEKLHGTITVFRNSDFKPILRYSSTEPLIGFCAISEDAKTLVIGKVKREAVFGSKSMAKFCAVDSKTGQVKDAVNVRSITAIAASEDASITACGDSGGYFLVRDTVHHRTLLDREIGHGVVTALFLSSNGRRLMTKDTGSVIQVWDIPSGAVVFEHKGADDAVMTPDGRYVVITGGGTRVYDTWQLRRKGLSREFELAVNPTGTTEASRIVTNTGKNLEFLNPYTLATERTVPRSGISDEVSSSAEFVLENNGEHSKIISVSSGRVVCSIPILSRNGFDASPDGRLFAVIDETSDVLHVFDLSGKELWRTALPEGCYTCKFSPNGRILSAPVFSGDVPLFDSETGAKLRILKGLSQIGRDIVFTKDSQYAAVTGDDRRILVFDLTSNEAPVECDGHTAMVWSLALSPDGKRLLSCGLDGIRMWDPKTGAQVLQVSETAGTALLAGFDPKATSIHYETWTGTVKVIPTP